MRNTEKLYISIQLAKRAAEEKHPNSNALGRGLASMLPEAQAALNSPLNAAMNFLHLIPSVGGPLRRRALLGSSEVRNSNIDNLMRQLKDVSYTDNVRTGSRNSALGLGGLLGGLGLLASPAHAVGGMAMGGILGGGYGAASGVLNKFLSNNISDDSKTRATDLIKKYPYATAFNPLPLVPPVVVGALS